MLVFQYLSTYIFEVLNYFKMIVESKREVRYNLLEILKISISILSCVPSFSEQYPLVFSIWIKGIKTFLQVFEFIYFYEKNYHSILGSYIFYEIMETRKF